mmetsp:Transcript_32901/g.40684  ORF Transcript_32901/g.40684 Transcript_32901/m.40684 type:complete len:203 (+) Transcript_32901:33-641(+)
MRQRSIITEGSRSASHAVHGSGTLVLLAPLDVAGVLCSCILFDQTAHDFLGVVELVETVPEERCLREVLYVGLSTLKLVKLDAQRVEDAPHTRVVRQHHAAHLVRRRHVRALLCQGNLDRGGAPRDEVCQLALTDALQGLVDLGRVHIALDNVQNRDVGPLFDACVNEDVLGVKEASHDVEDGSLADRVDACIEGEWRVASH